MCSIFSLFVSALFNSLICLFLPPTPTCKFIIFNCLALLYQRKRTDNNLLYLFLLNFRLSTHITILALLNLLLSPFIFLYQLLYFFFRYADVSILLWFCYIGAEMISNRNYSDMKNIKYAEHFLDGLIDATKKTTQKLFRL